MQVFINKREAANVANFKKTSNVWYIDEAWLFLSPKTCLNNRADQKSNTILNTK